MPSGIFFSFLFCFLERIVFFTLQGQLSFLLSIHQIKKKKKNICLKCLVNRGNFLSKVHNLSQFSSEDDMSVFSLAVSGPGRARGVGRAAVRAAGNHVTGRNESEVRATRSATRTTKRTTWRRRSRRRTHRGKANWTPRCRKSPQTHPNTSKHQKQRRVKSSSVVRGGNVTVVFPNSSRPLSVRPCEAADPPEHKHQKQTRGYVILFPSGTI